MSEDVLRRIADAIDEIASNDELQRTKRQIEKLASLSHPTVARAFAQDLREKTPFAINARFAALNPVNKGLSPKEQVARREKQDLEAARERIVELETQRDAHLQALYAYFVASSPKEPSPTVVPINRAVRKADGL
ncbi:hypothetical protein [Microbacterium aerolatum]|uniref:hypothetical protein n=1 Tax=Microbacterium aerolatum TaxID=153731 RepID=UPI0011BE0680|nr:hypothetical protein [Microbacterium aerolatum]